VKSEVYAATKSPPVATLTCSISFTIVVTGVIPLSLHGLGGFEHTFDFRRSNKDQKVCRDIEPIIQPPMSLQYTLYGRENADLDTESFNGAAFLSLLNVQKKLGIHLNERKVELEMIYDDYQAHSNIFTSCWKQ